MEGIATTMKSNYFVEDVVEMAHDMMASEFDLFMDVMYTKAPRMFHHVYEWNSLAGQEPGMGRLWQHTFNGSGHNRVASWSWLTSKKPVPTPMQRAQNDEDPMSQLSNEQIAKFSKRRYFFPMKAPVMEYNQSVYIAPTNGKVIVFPVWDELRPLRVSKGLSVRNPGGEETSGSFTTAWMGWWSTKAPDVFDDVVRTIVERDIDDAANDTLRRTTRTRTIGLSMNAKGSYDMGLMAGRQDAQRELRKKSSRYKNRRRK
jgi:hypothetical protein